ncbi:hypothetical protein L228DRAFT_243689 [Xylona heveae TC161]|uniref:Uncharacterized protein n=1 Tax=Xylona heveae (strain CBS 132557 / TC161) TaxID=1328760 RepID=A0A161TFT3_XYLHT|nr:hypothetical protein L228DRAFT_243689 [Xylona heveae TC161]KZF24937.1 hypothetical protein L228DRAFT_243689 [Xylona heveae TC161]
MIQVLKALNRIGDMPDGYVSTFHEFVDQLQPVHDQVILLRNLLKSIKDEGNELDVSEKSADPVKHVQSEESRSSRKLVSELGTEHTEIVSPNLPTDSEHKPEPVSEPASTPKPETEAEAEDAPVSKVASLGIAPFPPPILLPPPVGLQTEIYKPLNDTPIAPVPFSDPIVYDHFRRPPTPRPANCPIWKYNLQEKGLVDIHVGQAEIDAFARAYQGINGIEISLRALITQCELLYDESGDAAAQLIEWENLLADHEHEYRHRQAISSSSAGEDWPSDAPNMSETD